MSDIGYSKKIILKLVKATTLKKKYRLVCIGLLNGFPIEKTRTTEMY